MEVVVGFGGRELLILLLIALLLFGASRLPQLARSLGRSARILKAETQGLTDDSTGDDDDDRGRQAPRADTAAPAPHEPGDHQPRRAELPPGRPVDGTTQAGDGSQVYRNQ
nr:twin-arginine translocase TatA/TatE family subunit [Streptomonospora nanhaiensis]